MKQSPVVARWVLSRFASCTPAALQGDMPIGAPHTLYYFVSVVLPFTRRSGFVLVPLVIFFTGLFSCRTAVEMTRVGTNR